MLILRKAYENTIEEEEKMRRRSTIMRSLILKPTIHIGKSGLTDAQVNEIIKQLEAKGKIKVKVLKTALINETVESLAQKASSKTGSKIIQIIGHTFTLYKPRKKGFRKK
jgi:RNA-binding protein